MKVRILAGAYRELSRGVRFYDARDEGLGSYFLETLLAEIDELEFSAGIHSVRFERFHRKISKRFPFAIYYRIDGDTVVVRAVLDCRIDPDRVKKRLR